MHDCACGCGQACDCDMDDTWLDTPSNCASIGCSLCRLDCFNCICHEYDQ